MKDSVTEEELKKAFSKFGEITSVCLKKSKELPFLKEPLQFGFVNYKKKEDASEAFFNGKKDPEILALVHDEKK